MANLRLFQSFRGAKSLEATATNEAGGDAYLRDPHMALALYASTGCLNGTFYADASVQLERVIALCEAVPAEFVAKVAIHARQHAHMKDMPALLAAWLAQHDGELLEKVFDRVIDNGRMLRSFVQIVRSGVVGRRSLGSRPKRLVRRWLDKASVEQVMSAAIGTQPSLVDVVRMVHPQPASDEREALYGWLLDRPHDARALPALVKRYETFKADPSGEPPDLPFAYLTSLPLSAAQWTTIALRCSWQTLRMNLNTFARHGVFEDRQVVARIARRLADPSLIRRSRVLPYQLMVAARAAEATLPKPIAKALDRAMDEATRSVPTLEGRLVVALDVSGSMSSPVTGYRPGATTVVTCVEVAALIAASLLRANPKARIMPFDTAVRRIGLDLRDGVMVHARRLAGMRGGGTAISAPVRALVEEQAQLDLLVIVSDNQSWVDTRGGQGGTETMRQWAALKQRNPRARMVCIDLQPYATGQTVDNGSGDILHIAGFSDAVFDLLADAATGDGARRWMRRIEATALP